MIIPSGLNDLSLSIQNFTLLFCFASVQWRLWSITTTVKSSHLLPHILKCSPTGSLICFVFIVLLILLQWSHSNTLVKQVILLRRINNKPLLLIFPLMLRSSVSNRMPSWYCFVSFLLLSYFFSVAFSQNLPSRLKFSDILLNKIDKKNYRNFFWSALLVLRY